MIGVTNTSFLRQMLLSVFMLLGCSLVAADESKVPPPKGDQCVEDPAWMRVHHYETILHQRDETVLNGIRTRKHSLKNCIDCHITANAEGDYAHYANSEEHFCASCHSYAAVQIDCFQCHADRPEKAVRDSIKELEQKGVDPHAVMNSTANDLILNSSLLSAQ